MEMKKVQGKSRIVQQLAFQLGDKDQVIFEELSNGCAQRVTNSATLSAALYFHKCLHGTVVRRHFQHGLDEVTKGRIQARGYLKDWTGEAVFLDRWVI